MKKYRNLAVNGFFLALLIYVLWLINTFAQGNDIKALVLNLPLRFFFPAP
ncbi:MAG: hypothetical protein K6U80_14405 [Firmicutes bacterium]|nr:hypothetical protein [Bacillota bacterium]